ncbi:MAG: tetratricopeptide repeat protein, partial [Marinirhabdus sp.]|nr:tetratricopeptide repeat protein [Marinirhabdus sp.]
MYSPLPKFQTLCFLLLCLNFNVFQAQELSDDVIDDFVATARKNTNNADSLYAIGQRTVSYSKERAMALGLMEGYFMQGYSRYLKGQFDDAIALFNKGIEVDPDTTATYQ